MMIKKINKLRKIFKKILICFYNRVMNNNLYDKNKVIATSRIQSRWREFKVIKLLKQFSAFNLNAKGETRSFDDFTKIMVDKDIVNIAGELIYALQARLRINLKINNRILMSAYLFSYYPNELLGDEKKRDPLASQIYFYSKILTNSLVFNSNLEFNRLQWVLILGENMLNFSESFSVWKLRDKSEMVQNMMLSYYQRQVHIDKIKKGELDGAEEQLINSIKVLEDEQEELLRSIKLVDKKFDVKYFKKNYSKIYQTMEDDYAKLQVAITNNMKIAYFDYVKEGMEKGDYNPLLALITEVRERIVNIVPEKVKQEIKDKVNIEKAKDKIATNDFGKTDVIRLIIHCVNYIGKVQAPIDDESFNQWKEEIAQDLQSNSDNFCETVPEILIQAEERLDKVYKDLASLVAK